MSGLRDRYVSWVNVIREKYNPVDIAVFCLAQFLNWDAYHDADFVLNINKVSFYAMAPWLQDLYVGCQFLIGFAIIGVLLFWDKVRFNAFLHAVIGGSILTEAWLYLAVAKPAYIPVFWFAGISPSYGVWVAWILGRKLFAWLITAVWDLYVP